LDWFKLTEGFFFGHQRRVLKTGNLLGTFVFVFQIRVPNIYVQESPLEHMKLRVVFRNCRHDGVIPDAVDAKVGIVQPSRLAHGHVTQIRRRLAENKDENQSLIENDPVPMLKSFLRT
jgi:hypothetical protein